MARLAIVGGRSLMGSGLDPVDQALHVGSAHVVLQRHGAPDHTPAHRVDHVANMRSLVAHGCDRVLALNSVGGLHHDVGTGTFLAPDDFIALHTSISIHDDARGYSIPAFDRDWRQTVIDAWRARASAIAPLRDGGVYWQAFGPRFETPAEIRFIGQFADVVGMTMASECIVARELGLQYASVCIVDNLANGLREQPLTWEEFEAGKRANQEALLAALAVVTPELA
jgi:5'-methylthioadenosine phosphorylase